MQQPEIENKKAIAFSAISEILFELSAHESNDLEKAGHVLDILEQLTARIIASSCLEMKHVEQMAEETKINIETLAKQYLEDELAGNDK